jgi:hypothetical protein
MSKHSVKCIFAMAAAVASGAVIAEPRPIVVELYTSEGCSSCPPAEAFMGVLAQRSDVLPLSFHVDYWDNQGWHDRFSSSDATRRQHVYASKLHHDSVYTPQAIIENSSRTLQEFNIVRSIKRLGTWNGSTCSFRILLSSLPADATHAAVLLQASGQGPILGATSLALPTGD